MLSKKSAAFCCPVMLVRIIHHAIVCAPASWGRPMEPGLNIVIPGSTSIAGTALGPACLRSSDKHGVGDLLYIGLGLATIGMIPGIAVGTMLVNYAIKSPSIPVARQNPTSPDEDLDIDHHPP